MIKESDSTPKVSEAPGGYRIGLAASPPSPEEQLAFLAKLQRIFEEGEFTATYKFALLVALTELAVERGADDNRSLPLQIRWIAEKFAELYWSQTIEYSTRAMGTTPALLAQNLGATARVVSGLTNLRRSSGASTIAVETIVGELGERGFLVDPTCSLVVARWAYQQAANTGAHAWTSAAKFDAVGPEYIAALR